MGERVGMRVHHAVAFGVVAQTLGIDARGAALGFGYVVVAGVVSAALRLGLVGQNEGQRILRDAWPALEESIDRALGVGRGELAAFAPLTEIAMMRHERAYTRLFAS